VIPNVDSSRSGIGTGIKDSASRSEGLATLNADLPYSGLGLRLDHITGGSMRLRTPIRHFDDRQKYLSGSLIYGIVKRAMAISRVVALGIWGRSLGDDRT